MLLALFTPLADPARLSVADQLRRLESDAVAPAQFDFAFLRSEGARYGREALERLKAGGEGPRAAEIAERAGRALAQRDYARPAEPPTAQQRAANITVHPAGAVLPDGFLLQNWTAESQPGQTPRCLIGHDKCDARLVDLDGDDVAEVLLVSRSFGPGTAYRREADGRWRVLGVIGNLHCKGAREAFRSGEVEAVAPRWRELQAGSHRLTIAENC